MQAAGIRRSKIDNPVHAAAGSWFLHSGIQADCGGVARYYRFDLGTNARVSTEITGYSVSTLLFLYQRTGQAAYLDRALDAARFLTRTAWDRALAAFPFEYPVNSGPGAALSYFFDCGIITRGLLSAWRMSGETEFRDAAVATGCAMLADFLTLDTIHPILALPEKIPVERGTRWSAKPGCYQLKAALAWRELFDITADLKFLEAYESSVVSALATADEFLPGDTDSDNVMDRLHAYLYFLGGLMPILDRPERASTFRSGLDRATHYLREIAPRFVRSDVCAQLLRARLYGESVAAITIDMDAAADEAAQISSFQITSDNPRLNGGFLFGRRRGEPVPFMNPVSTAFCLQALTWWEDRKNNCFEADWHALI